MMDELRCASVVCGVQYVPTDGTTEMLQFYVDSWDMTDVSLHHSPF